AEVFHISQQRSSLNIQYVADAGNGVVSAGSPNGCVAVMNVGGSGTMNGDSGSFALTLPFTASQKARVEAHGDATSISGTLQLEGKELIVNETGSSASGTIVLVPSSSSYCQSALHCPLIAPGS
ncbi:MAG TPA: hypothetical protein VMU77_04630, partial [Acidimicrobiales bacterium]|nr:hypothetical protein [Acidimicrobiales bacterium]